MNAKLSLLALVMGAAMTLSAAEPFTDKIPVVVKDLQDSQQPDRLRMSGWIGNRFVGNEKNRLARIDTNRLLEGYRKRPGRQTWDGEHVGKWLHAATLAWAYSGDPTLRRKLDTTVTELCKCQLEDGYLGTYLDKDRWVEWDVWAHKYNLLGLITYMRYTGNQDPLPTCLKMADLLCRTFGEQPGQRNILKAGHHVGMAPTSVLEPMVWLYRATGEPRYLEFCNYLLRSWEQPDGPKIFSTLLRQKRVDKVGNGKAYEMLSCLNGALEYYRTVGDSRVLQACLYAWQDIVDNRLYITGAASHGELFHDDFDLPNTGNVGETCVTVTWLQFNAHLLRLTGEARFAEQLERVILNQLMGAQRPDCAAWGYYVQMEGKKPYSDTLDGHCCLSSGPRGLALVPTFAVTTDRSGVVMNLYDAGNADLRLHDGTSVFLKTKTLYPTAGSVEVMVGLEKKKAFAFKFRVPAWTREFSVRVDGKLTEAILSPDGYGTLERVWKNGEVVRIQFGMEPRLVLGDHLNAGKAAVMYGPLVLAMDQALVSAEGLPWTLASLPGATLESLGLKAEPAQGPYLTWEGAELFRVKAVTGRSTKTLPAGSPMDVRLVPFADAGGAGSAYKVWIPIRGATRSNNLLVEGVESRSRAGNLEGSIADDDVRTVVGTFDGKPAAEDWYAITSPVAVLASKILFAHGKTFHDGGWFDASDRRPQVQVQLVHEGRWETVGELRAYPATTDTEPAGLKAGEVFEFSLPEPKPIYGVRVIGKPASGDKPDQAFSSCAELQVLGRE